MHIAARLLAGGGVKAEDLCIVDPGPRLLSRWHPMIYVSGPLAELELRPPSRMIAGARHAADRVIAAIRDDAGMESKVSGWR